jgi:hypothetical protein
MTITQVSQAKKVIREWFPGKANARLRNILRAQLSEALNEDRTAKVKLGKGVLFLEGSGDQRVQNFNSEINNALGLN